MIRQKSFSNENSTLYLVPTPIGNLQEMTPRALEILNSVDVTACEDTRTSGQLLKHFDIHKRLIAYQNFNEESRVQCFSECIGRFWSCGTAISVYRFFTFQQFRV